MSKGLGGETFTRKVYHMTSLILTLNAPIATKVLCFSHLLKCLRSLYGKQCGPRFWVPLFASILNSSVMLGNYLQQTTSADNIFRCIFFLGPLSVKSVCFHDKIWSELVHLNIGRSKRQTTFSGQKILVG